MSLAATSLADPAGADVLVAAVQWLQFTLLGTVATTIAVLCVAFVGFMMLIGRVEIRRGLSVVLGCFILFGASSIVAGLRGGIEAPTQSIPLVPPPPAQPVIIPAD